MKHFGAYSPVLGLRRTFRPSFWTRPSLRRRKHGTAKSNETARKCMRQLPVRRPRISMSAAILPRPSLTAAISSVRCRQWIPRHLHRYRCRLRQQHRPHRLTATGGRYSAIPSRRRAADSSRGAGALYTDGLETDPNEAAFMRSRPRCGACPSVFDMLDDESNLYLFAFTPTSIICGTP